jgi:hypothetical protein
MPGKCCYFFAREDLQTFLEVVSHLNEGCPLDVVHAIVGLSGAKTLVEIRRGHLVASFKLSKIDLQLPQLCLALLTLIRKELVQGAIHDLAGLPLLV